MCWEKTSFIRFHIMIASFFVWSRCNNNEAAPEYDPDEDEDEMQMLASKLAMLENAVSGLDFNPAGRPITGGGAAASVAPAAAAPAQRGPASPARGATAPAAQVVPNARAKAAAQIARSVNVGSTAPLMGVAGRGNRVGGGIGSTAALEDLARELASLEEKKRVVEQLARKLEPPSDNEEDDGFPLR